MSGMRIDPPMFWTCLLQNIHSSISILSFILWVFSLHLISFPLNHKALAPDPSSDTTLISAEQIQVKFSLLNEMVF